jgi:site-specific DNA-methyltransferase (cytosine-N4-specific)
VYEILVGDTLSLDLGEGRYRSCVTSPPYFGLRSYGEDGQEIGKDQDLDEYIESLVEVFRKVRDSLTEDGTLWLNMGDCYNGSGGAGSDYKKGGRKEGRNKYGSRSVAGIAPKNLLGVAWRLALALQADGWILRSEIIWNKSKAYPQPEAYIKRPIPRHETIFMLAKNPDYHYVPDNLFTVWDMTPVSKSGHEAPFPLDLPMKCILASTDEGDWVLDPFSGSGTTAVAAQLANRNSTMCELYPDVAERMAERLASLPDVEGKDWL